MIKRREFLHLSLTMLLSGIIGLDKLKLGLKPYKLEKVGNLVHIAYHESHVIIGDEERTIDTKGCGVILEDFYITLCHIVQQRKIPVDTPFGPKEIPVNFLYSTSFLDPEKTIPLKPLCLDESSDIAIFKINQNIPEERKWKYGYSFNYNIGDKVYIIGNPQLSGTNIRETTISDLSGSDIVKIINNSTLFHTFGVGAIVIPGDSGSPVVNEKYQILGLSMLYFSGLGYVKEIKPFIDIMKKN